MIEGHPQTLKDVKQLEKRLAILEEENEILSRIAWQALSGHLTSQKIVRNVGLPLVNQFLAQGYALVRILSALKIKPSTYYNWRHWQPSRQEKRRESLKPYILDVWKTFKFYGYRRIAAYSQLTNDCPKISEYMTLKLMRELRIRSSMQNVIANTKPLWQFLKKLIWLGTSMIWAVFGKQISLIFSWLITDGPI